MYSKYTAHINSNRSHFLLLGSWCTEHLRSSKMGTTDTVRGYYVLQVYCTYKLKWKPLLDDWVLGVLHI